MYAEYRGAGRTKPTEEWPAHRWYPSDGRRKRARLGGPGKRKPTAGPVTYLLLRGEGNRRTQAGPVRSASSLRVIVLHSASNVCTLDPMMLAGIPVRDQDVLELARLLRDCGFDDTAEKLEDGYDVETKVLALTIDDREAILRALDDPPDGLAELRGVLLRGHEWRVREGLV